MLSLSKFPPALAKRMPGSSRVYPTTRSPVPTNKPAPTGERAKDEVVVKDRLKDELAGWWVLTMAKSEKKLVGSRQGAF